MAAFQERTAGQTTFGSLHENACLVAVQTKAATASGLCLIQPNGTEKVLWVNDSGELWISTRAEFIAMSGGAKVGGQ